MTEVVGFGSANDSPFKSINKGKPLYEFTGNSNNGHFKYLGEFGILTDTTNWIPITDEEAGITEQTHDFSKNWDTGDFYLKGRKDEWGGANGKGYALMINSYSAFFKDGDKIYYLGGFSIL